jgi:SHS2 domain-containing protein
MLNWLCGLIAIVDVEKLFFSKFEVNSITEKKMIASCYGEPISPEKGGTVVKAVTKHNYKLEKTKEGYKVTVTLDI